MTRASYNAAMARIREIFMGRAGTPEGNELAMLLDQVVAYEAKHFPCKPMKQKRVGRPPLKPGKHRVSQCLTLRPQVVKAARRLAKRNKMSLSRTVEVLLQNWIEGGMP